MATAMAAKSYCNRWTKEKFLKIYTSFKAFCSQKEKHSDFPVEFLAAITSESDDP